MVHVAAARYPKESLFSSFFLTRRSLHIDCYNIKPILNKILLHIQYSTKFCVIFKKHERKFIS